MIRPLCDTSDSSLHNRIAVAAALAGISSEEFIAATLEEKLVALAAEQRMEERAARGTWEGFQNALEAVPDVEPESYDRISPLTAALLKRRDGNS